MVSFKTLKKAPISDPIIFEPDRTIPFEIMCDPGDFAVEVVLAHRKNNIIHPIYYASKTMNDTQIKYTTTKNELLAVVFAFETYLIGTKVIVHTKHSALKYLL